MSIIGKDDNGDSIYFYQVAVIYDYVDNNDYEDLVDSIKEAAKDAGK